MTQRKKSRYVVDYALLDWILDEETNRPSHHLTDREVIGMAEEIQATRIKMNTIHDIICPSEIEEDEEIFSEAELTLQIVECKDETAEDCSGKLDRWIRI